MNWRTLVTTGALLNLAVLAGCAPAFKRADIPLGEWKGTGTVVLDKWEAAEPGQPPPPPVIEHRRYPTSLKIARATLAQDDVIRIEILSSRGEMQELAGDRTHIVAQLKPLQTLADGKIRLYQLTRFAISTDETEPDEGDEPEGLAHASCMVVDDDELVLRIHYRPTFVDTFRFQGRRLYKDGSFYGEASDGLIHWSEELERKR